MFDYHGVKLSWLGHDGFRIQNGKVVYIDPFKIETGGPKADIVLISHEHFDHCSVEDLTKIVTLATVIVAHSQSKDVLAKLKVKEVKIMKPGDKINVGDITVEAVPAYNLNKFREPGKAFHPKEDGKVGFIVTMKGVRIYHAGDTDHIPEMKNVQTDIALLPVSGTYVMTAQEAADAASTIKPQVAIPMHYGSIVGNAADADNFRKLVKCEVKLLEKER
jgi:L-ascorbate metabolism protein UlaG (beta-lactamase superfamily)